MTAKRVRLGRRAAWGLAFVIASGALAFAVTLVLYVTAWAGVLPPRVNLIAIALESAVSVMACTGLLAFVYVGLSFGRWLSQRLEKPIQPQFEATEYPRQPLEAR